jgi:hypothetical protein
MEEHKHYPPTARESDWQEAAYVALLLGVPPSEIFPLWIDYTDNGNAHLVVAVMNIVDGLLRVCAWASDSPDLADDLRTLEYCKAVMCGTEHLVGNKVVRLYPDIRDNGYFGQGVFYNYHGYRRGAWTRWGRLLKGGSHV